MNCKRMIFSGHAVQRMFQRAIERESVEEVIASGEVIIEYDDDTPYPSRLVLGVAGGRPLHVVVAIDAASHTCIVVTVYQPDELQWGKDFKSRLR